MWADHGDYIANAYAGSGALKSDFTRTGKRTYLGALADGTKSIRRYVKNNYFDGPRQDAFDLFTGAWIPRGASSAYALFYDHRPLFTRAVRNSQRIARHISDANFFCIQMPYILSFAVFMMLAGLTLPRSSGEHFFYC